MADTKTSALTVFSIDAEDLLYAVDDPSSTPTSGKILASSLMFNRYKLVVTVATNDLTVKITHPDGNNPSSARPLYFKIGDTVRSATAALSVTLTDGTNWFNSGSAELGTLAVPYFVYVVWDSNSSIVDIAVARKPHYKIVAASMGTSTNDNYISDAGNYTAGDDMANIGYFEAILSLSGTSHLWTVPTFTNDNLRHEPTYESQWMTFAASPTGFSAAPASPVYRYMVLPNRCTVSMTEGNAGTSNLTTKTYTAPFTAVTITGASWSTSLTVPYDNGATAATGSALINSNSATITAYKTASGAWTDSGACSPFFFGVALTYII